MSHSTPTPALGARAASGEISAQRVRARLSPARCALVLAVLLVLSIAAAVLCASPLARERPRAAWEALLALAGFPVADVDPTLRALLGLRLWRALTAAGVGAALSYSGALLQGLFQNSLASPSVLGITSGASLGAALAACLVGGLGGALFTPAGGLWNGALLVPLAAFVGALAIGALVHRLGSTHGRLSVPALLLVGLAMNTFLGGAQSLLQQLVLGRWEVSRSILSWSFGTLLDRQPWHVIVVWALLVPCLALAPRLAWELDLLQSGEEDARALGVDTLRVRRLALVAATLATAAAVAVAGQIAFVGLIVPHLVRLAGIRGHRALLPLSALLGASFLVGADLAQSVLTGDRLQPGVVLSVLGGPFFVYLLWRRRHDVRLA